MSRQPRLRKLRMALAVRQTGRFSGAADMLGVTQPAVTHAIASLEDQLGVKLFDRSTAHIAVTRSGRVVLDRAQRAFRWLETATARLRTGNILDASDHELHALIAVHAHRSVGRAAASLALSQPALSRSLNTLESRLGTTLFERSESGMITRPDTATLVRHVKLAFAELRQAEDELRLLLGAAGGRIAIGALPLARSALVPSGVLGILHDYPEANVSIVDGTYESLVQLLREGDIDVIVGSIRQDAESPELATRILFDDSLAVIAASDHPLTTVDAPDLAQMVEYGWVLPLPGVPLRRQFDALIAAAGLELGHGVVTTDSTAALRALVLGSRRLAIASIHQVKSDIDRGLLATLPFSAPGPRRSIGLTLRRDYVPTALFSGFLGRLETIAGGYAL